MVEQLVVIIGVYALSACVVHRLHARTIGRNQEQHWVVITRNNGNRVEWVLRVISGMSWISGRDALVTVIDTSSSDDTMPIVERWGRRRELQVLSASSEAEALRLAAELGGASRIRLTRMDLGEDVLGKAAW